MMSSRPIWVESIAQKHYYNNDEVYQLRRMVHHKIERHMLSHADMQVQRPAQPVSSSAWLMNLRAEE